MRSEGGLQFETFKRLLLAMAQQRSVAHLLRLVTDHLAATNDVALVRHSGCSIPGRAARCAERPAAAPTAAGACSLSRARAAPSSTAPSGRTPTAPSAASRWVSARWDASPSPASLSRWWRSARKRTGSPTTNGCVGSGSSASPASPSSTAARSWACWRSSPASGWIRTPSPCCAWWPTTSPRRSSMPGPSRRSSGSRGRSRWRTPTSARRWTPPTRSGSSSA